METTNATLARLADPVYRTQEDRVFQAFAAGGGDLVARHEVILENAACKLVDDRPAVTFHRSSGTIEATMAGLALPEDWKPFGRLALTLTAPDEPARLEITVVGARCRLIDQAELDAGQVQTVNVDLADLALTAGIRPTYQPAAVRLSLHWQNDSERTVTLHDLALIARDGDPPAVVDRFGQRIHADWPGKVTDPRQLVERRRQEARQLENIQPPADRDRFGGWTGGPTFQPGGFFRLEQDDGGRWWLVDPEGNPFWSVGITSIRIDASEFTPIDGREHLFEALPDPTGPHGAARLSPDNHIPTFRRRARDHVSFYAWNVLRKYESESDWADRVLQRFGKWGVNTVGGFTQNPLFLEQQRIPHTRLTRTRSRNRDDHAFVGRFADAFDPRWEQWLDDHFAEFTAPCRENPWLIGYFVDNEASWRNPRLLSCEPGLPLRGRWLAFCRERFDTPQSAGDAFAVPCETWDDVRNLSDEQIAHTGPGRDAMDDFEALFAEQYFSTVARLLRKHDPNHLYLGCRFTKVAPAAGVLQACGRHVDVCSVNCYTYPPPKDNFDFYHAQTGRPVIIGEFHFPLSSARQLPPLWRCYTPQERYDWATGYFRWFAERPYALGCHWFQHADQPITGRWSNGESQPIGLVDITDQPHDEMVRVFRTAAEHAPRWHAISQG